MDGMSAVALALGVAWASGINLYATVLIVGGLGAVGAVDLPPDLAVLQTPPVLVSAGVLYALDFFADKVPGIDSLNDALHTFIRVPAGALMAMGAVSGIAEPWQAALALIVGGVVAAGSHTAKAGSRAIINTSPEPFSNWFASIFEDVIVLIGLLLALFKPAVFLIWMAVFVLFLAWFLPKLWRGLQRLWARIRAFNDERATHGTGRALVRSLGHQPAARPKAGPPAADP